MLKKMKSESGAKDSGAAKDTAQSVLESSRQIWLAGLGAFSRAQAEGRKMFETLVRQGLSLESLTRKAAGDTAAAASGAAKAKAKEMQTIAGDTWDKLEQVFEDRVARALKRLGIHTHEDVQRLAQRVDALSESVNRLLKQTPAKARPAAGARPKSRKGKSKKAAK